MSLGAVLLAGCPLPDSTTGDSDSGASTGATATTGMTGASATTSDEAPTSGATASGTTDVVETSGTTSELPPGVECVVDADCEVFDDCCTCDAQPVDSEEGTCQLACEMSACETEFPIAVAAACRGGVCAFVAGSCTGTPACGEPAPECEHGEIPAIAGECWGECVSPLECGGSCPGPDPNSCGVGWVCVDSQSGGETGCRPLPHACDGVASCDCLAPDTCVNGSCADYGSGQVVCEDGG